MGMRKIYRLSDLRGDQVWARCRKCGHEGRVDPIAIHHRKLHISTHLSALPLKCTACGCAAFDWWVETPTLARTWQDAFRRPDAP